MIRRGSKLSKLTGLVNYGHRNVAKLGSFPYKFGGIPGKEQNSYQDILTKQLFGDDVFEGFKDAYVSFLHALQEGNQSFFHDILEPNLTKDLALHPCNLVHEESPIETRINKTFMVLGLPFQRPPNSKVTIMKEQPSKGMQFLMSMNQNTFKMGMGLPFIYGVEIYFKSAIKLIQSSTPPAEIDSEQFHMLQFQICSQLNPMNMMKLMPKIEEAQRGSKGMAPELFHELLGDNYEWKIGDVDQICDRNFIIGK